MSHSLGSSWDSNPSNLHPCHVWMILHRSWRRMRWCFCMIWSHRWNTNLFPRPVRRIDRCSPCRWKWTGKCSQEWHRRRKKPNKQVSLIHWTASFDLFDCISCGESTPIVCRTTRSILRADKCPDDQHAEVGQYRWIARSRLSTQTESSIRDHREWSLVGIRGGIDHRWATIHRNGRRRESGQNRSHPISLGENIWHSFSSAGYSSAVMRFWHSLFSRSSSRSLFLVSTTCWSDGSAYSREVSTTNANGCTPSTTQSARRCCSHPRFEAWLDGDCCHHHRITRSAGGWSHADWTCLKRLSCRSSCSSLSSPLLLWPIECMFGWKVRAIDLWTKGWSSSISTTTIDHLSSVHFHGALWWQPTVLTARTHGEFGTFIAEISWSSTEETRCSGRNATDD